MNVTFYIYLGAGAEAVLLELTRDIPVVPQLGMRMCVGSSEDFRTVEGIDWDIAYPDRLFVLFSPASDYQLPSLLAEGWTANEPTEELEAVAAQERREAASTKRVAERESATVELVS